MGGISEALIRGMFQGLFLTLLVALLYLPFTISRKRKDRAKVKVWIEEFMSRYHDSSGNGDVQGLFARSGKLFYGDGNQVDYSEATKLARMAAERGHAKAQLSLGYAYENGLGVPQEYAEAFIWYSTASLSGNADAANSCKRMADLLSSGDLRVAKKVVSQLTIKIEQRRVGQINANK